MARVYSPIWPLVAVLVALYLAHDLGAKQQLAQQPAAVLTSAIRVQYIPDPNDIVNLAEGTPYVVPDGKILIITDWDVNPINDSPGGAVATSIRVDGNAAWGCFGIVGGSLQTGIRAAAGQTVTLDTLPPNPYLTVLATGYLAKAN